MEDGGFISAAGSSNLFGNPFKGDRTTVAQIRRPNVSCRRRWADHSQVLLIYEAAAHWWLPPDHFLCLYLKTTKGTDEFFPSISATSPVLLSFKSILLICNISSPDVSCDMMNSSPGWQIMPRNPMVPGLFVRDAVSHTLWQIGKQWGTGDGGGGNLIALTLHFFYFGCEWGLNIEGWVICCGFWTYFLLTCQLMSEQLLRFM